MTDDIGDTDWCDRCETCGVSLAEMDTRVANPTPPTLISVDDDMPEVGERVIVYSEKSDQYGTARIEIRNKFGASFDEWVFDVPQSISLSPISHWYPRPVVE